MSNLLTRVLVALVAIPLFVVLVLTGGWTFAVFVAVLSALGVREFCQLMETKGASPNALLTLTAAFVLPLSLYFDTLHQSSFAFASAIVFSVLILATELWRERAHPLMNIAASLGALSYVSLLFMSLILIRSFSLSTSSALGASLELHSNWQAFVLLCACITVWTGDSAAYFVGMSIGRHKIFPRVSPKKSWEGSIAGFIASPLAFGLSAQALIPEFPVLHAIILGALIGVVGPIGDFAESLLKRDAAIKDSSAIIPGHGGVLDRFDSLLFVAPLLYVYLTLVQ